MAETEAKGQSPEAGIILRRGSETTELSASTDEAADYLLNTMAALRAAVAGGFLQANPFVMDHVNLQPGAGETFPEAPPAGSELTLADLRTPKHFQDYFVYRMGMFLGREVSLALPSQEHVDRGQRIKDARLTSFEPVVFPNLTIAEGFQYPDAWQFPLDPWVYHQIRGKNLTSDVLNLEERWGWLDTSERLDWKSGDPMFDPKTDQVVVDLLTDLRAKGKEEGIEVTRNTKHLNPRSWYGISAVEAETKVFTAMAGMIGVGRQDVVALTVAQHNFIGNWLYPHLGEKNSWDWLRNHFGAGYQLIAGHHDFGGLSYVYRYLFRKHHGYIRPRPLVLSPSAA